jgi:hypothetical protein
LESGSSVSSQPEVSSDSIASMSSK